MTPRAKRPSTDPFLDVLEGAVGAILKNPKATRLEKNDAIANGIKLAAIRHKIDGGADDGDFFGGET